MHKRVSRETNRRPSTKRLDDVDVACDGWAVVMRELLGLRDPDHARGFLGPLRCTLAARRDLHHGARTEKPEQHWPEFPFARCQPEVLTVHHVYKRLDDPLAELLVAHYVILTPRDKRIRAELMGLSPRVYWDRLARAKAAVQGALLVVDTVRTLSAPNGAISAMRQVAS